jgi:hypothetical protein
MIPLSARGSGRADRSEMQNFRIAKSTKNKILKSFVTILFHEIDRELFSARSHSCSQDQEQGFRLFAS